MIHIIIIGRQFTMQEFAAALSEALMNKGYKRIKIFYYEKIDLRRGGRKKTPINFSPDINIIVDLQHCDEELIIPNNNSTKILILPEQRLPKWDTSKWDRVLTFFRHLSDKDKNILYFPLGYSSRFCSEPISAKEHDTYFFGSLTKDRIKFLDKFKIYYEQKCYGHKRDSYIHNAKINVNIIPRNHREYFFAPLHALLILCKGKFLLQQSCEKDYSLYKPYIKEFKDESDYQKTVDYWLKNKQERIQFGINAKNALMNDLDFNEQFLNCVSDIL